MLLTLFCSLVPCQTIEPIQTYFGVKQGVIVNVSLPEEHDTGKLWLLDQGNNQLGNSATVTSGTHDVSLRITELANIDKAVWLQLAVDGKPVGAPLVVSPLLSRDVPVTEEALRGDGKSTYTKIVDWKNEAEDDSLDSPFVSGYRVYRDEYAVMKTSEGDIRIMFRPDIAPNTVWNFLELAKNGFYTETIFHRVVPMTSKGFPFVIQGGDPTGTGSGGPGWWLPIENSSLPHDLGVISMARANHPDSGGSQFFFCLSREGTARLDGQYCSFGETIDGIDVIQKIASTPLEDALAGTPKDAPTVHSIVFEPAEPRTPNKAAH